MLAWLLAFRTIRADNPFRLMRITIFLFLFLVLQQPNAWAQDLPMADTLREDGKIWVVVISVLVVLIGFLAYLVRLDGRISKLEKKKQA